MSSITFTYTSKVSEVDRVLNAFRSSIAKGSCVIGLDIDFTQRNNLNETKIANIYLCNRKRCLVVMVSFEFVSTHNFNSLPPSLRYFLCTSRATFVGIRIKENVARIEKEYGVKCRNAVELGEMAARIRNDPLLAYCGVLELAVRVIEPKKTKAEILKVVEAKTQLLLSESMSDVYLFWILGNTLLYKGSNV